MLNLNRSNFSNNQQSLEQFADLAFTGALLAYRDGDADPNISAIFDQYRFPRDASEPDFETYAKANSEEYNNGLYSYIAFLRAFVSKMLAVHDANFNEYVLDRVYEVKWGEKRRA